MRAPTRTGDRHPHLGAPGATSRVSVESEALPCPPGCGTIARHVAGNALGDEGFMPQGSCGRHGVVASRTHISASELIAFATRHPVQRRESNLQSEGRLTFDMVARGTHERLRIHWGAPRERKGPVVLLERLGGGEPLSLFAWC